MCETKTPAELKKEYKQEYYKNNQERFKKIIKCEVCNCNIQKYTLNRHNKLKKHIENLKKNQELEFIKIENERLTKLLNDL
jgi:hypothetical protein